MAVFLDWCSIFQAERTEEELAVFKIALGNVNLWYGHLLVEKWLLTAKPEGAPVGMLQYAERGWPGFERQISELQSPYDSLFDLGKLGGLPPQDDDWEKICKTMDVGERPPPILPSPMPRRFDSGSEERYSRHFIKIPTPSLKKQRCDTENASAAAKPIQNKKNEKR